MSNTQKNEYLLKRIVVVNNSMNNDRDKDKIRRALQRFDLIPSKRKTKLEQNRYNRLGHFIDTAKCPNSLLIMKLCIKLIEDKNTITPELAEDLDPMFIEIVNYYNQIEPMTTEQVVITLHENHTSERKINSKLQQEKYNQKLQYEELLEEKNNKINELSSELNDMKNKYNWSEQKRMELIDKYDSDSETEESEGPEPIKEYQEQTLAVPVINYDTDDSDEEPDWKGLQETLEEKPTPMEENVAEREPSTEGADEDDAAKEAEELFKRMIQEQEDKRQKKRQYHLEKYGAYK